jgi:hypothetical protein
VGNIVKGLLPKENLYDFMDLARRSGLHLHDCSLKKTSLEDSFFKIVKGGESPAGSQEMRTMPAAAAHQG